LSENGGIGTWVFFLIVASIGAWIFWAGGINNAWYSLKYLVSADKVHVDGKPTDCDFMNTPLGDKRCHYEAAVTAYNAAGEVVGGDHAPKYGHDGNTGKPIISYDNGKTWNWLPAADIPDPKIKSVIVSWVKVTD